MSRNHLLRSAALAAALGLVAADRGRADSMPLGGGFDQSVSVMAAPHGSAMTNSGTGPTSVGFGDATITLAGAPALDLSSSGTGTDSVIANVNVSQTDPGVSPIDLDYAFRLTLRDADSDQSKVVDVTGRLTGTVSMNDQGVMSSRLQNTYDFPSYEVTIGRNDYTVTPTSFTPPQVGQGMSGAFGIHVSSFRDAHPLPEPTSLAVLAVGAAAGLAWRRRAAARGRSGPAGRGAAPGPQSVVIDF